MRLYAVTYHTESGDQGFVGIFGERPTSEHLATITRQTFPNEIVGEGDDEARTIFYKVYEGPEGALPPLPAPSRHIPTI